MTDTASADTSSVADSPATDLPQESPSGGGGSSSAPSPAQAPSAEPPQEGVQGDDDSFLDLDLPAGMKSFDRSYVEKVRAAEQRTRARLREAEAVAQERAAALERFSAFDGYSDDDMGIWTKMAADWKSENYTEVATMMQQIAANVLQDPTSTTAEKADAQAVIDNPTDAVDSLGPDDIRRLVREEAGAMTAEQQQAAAVEGVFEQIRSAGYEDGTPQSFQVLWFANNRTEGDIAKAIELQRAEEQAVIDRYVESLGKGGTPVRMPNLGGGGTPTTDPPKNLSEARHAAQAWLDERRSQG